MNSRQDEDKGLLRHPAARVRKGTRALSDPKRLAMTVVFSPALSYATSANALVATRSGSGLLGRHHCGVMTIAVPEGATQFRMIE